MRCCTNPCYAFCDWCCVIHSKPERLCQPHWSKFRLACLLSKPPTQMRKTNHLLMQFDDAGTSLPAWSIQTVAATSHVVTGFAGWHCIQFAFDYTKPTETMTVHNLTCIYNICFNTGKGLAMLLCPSLVLLMQNATASVCQRKLPGSNCSWTYRHALLLS